MAGIALGFLVEWIVSDNRFPLAGGTNEETRVQGETLTGLTLEQVLELRARSRVTSEKEIAAL